MSAGIPGPLPSIFSLDPGIDRHERRGKSRLRADMDQSVRNASATSGTPDLNRQLMTECGSVRRLPLAFAAAVALSGATAPAMAAVPDTTVPVAPTSIGTSIAPTTTAPPTVAAGAWILVDADTGAVLAGESIHEPHLPASTVKVITALTALRLNGAAGSVEVTKAAASRAPMRIGR